MSKEEMKSDIKGNSNSTTQIGVQNNNYHISAKARVKQENIKELKLDNKAFELLKNTIEDESNATIMLVKDFDGTHIQCGSAKFSVSSRSVGEREITYWEAALNDLIVNELIVDVGHKNEVFKVTKRGYEYYDNEMKISSKCDGFIFNSLHIEIIKMFKENDDSLWDSQLKKYYKGDYDKEIAFEELKDAGYIVEGGVGTFDDGWSYELNSSKKIEILKLLKEWK